MLISPAFAQTADAAGQSDLFTQMMPLVMIFVVFYFLLIRPQQKRAKQHKEMLGAIRRGDRIVTGGGILGTVTKVINDGELQVEIADGVKVRVDRGLVSNIAAKTDPVPKSSKADSKADNDDDTSGDDASGDDTSGDDDKKGGKGGKGGLKKLLSD